MTKSKYISMIFAVFWGRISGFPRTEAKTVFGSRHLSWHPGAPKPTGPEKDQENQRLAAPATTTSATACHSTGGLAHLGNPWVATAGCRTGNAGLHPGRERC